MAARGRLRVPGVNGAANGDAPDPAAIRVVAFDCYGTLLDFDERSFAPAIQALLRARGIDHSDGESVWSHWMEHSRGLARVNGRGPEQPLAGPEPPFLSFEETWTANFAHAFDKTDVDLDPHEALTHIFGLLAQAPPYAEAHEVVGTLRAAGIRVAVASNADDVHLYPALERAGFAQQAEVILTSEAVRSYKPRRPFFDELRRRLDVEAGEVLYVGDSPYADVTGARNAGLPACWVRRYEDTEREKHLHHDPHWRFPDLCGLLGLRLGGAL